MNLKDIHIFIIHYKKLTERKKYLDHELKSYGFHNIHWFDHIDRNNLSKEQLSLYKYDPEMYLSKNAIWKEYKSIPRPLTLGEIACCLSHIEIYDYICKNNIPYALIFEDDVILYDNFYNKLVKVFSELPENFDSCYLSDNFGWTVNNYKEKNGFGFLGSLNHNIYTENKCVYKMPSGKCADSFLISHHCAQILYKEIIPFCLPPDWEQTPIYIRNNMNVYWAEPSLTHAGSNDIYGSSVNRPGE